MSHILFQLTHLPPLGVYLFVLLWLAAESAGLPLPDEAVLLTLGFLAHRGTLQLLPLILCAATGAAIGSTISYTIGLALGRPVVIRLGRRLHLSQEGLEKAEAWMRRRGGIGVFLSRILPFARNLASYAAGIAAIPPRVFYPAMLLGSLVWCATITSLGEALGSHYKTVLSDGGRGLLIAAGLVAVGLLVWGGWKLWARPGTVSDRSRNP